MGWNEDWSNQMARITPDSLMTLEAYSKYRK